MSIPAHYTENELQTLTSSHTVGLKICGLGLDWADRLQYWIFVTLHLAVSIMRRSGVRLSVSPVFLS